MNGMVPGPGQMGPNPNEMYYPGAAAMYGNYANYMQYQQQAMAGYGPQQQPQRYPNMNPNQTNVNYWEDNFSNDVQNTTNNAAAVGATPTAAHTHSQQQPAYTVATYAVPAAPSYNLQPPAGYNASASGSSSK